jgi:hypothetical protein
MLHRLLGSAFFNIDMSCWRMTDSNIQLLSRFSDVFLQPLQHFEKVPENYRMEYIRNPFFTNVFSSGCYGNSISFIF